MTISECYHGLEMSEPKPNLGKGALQVLKPLNAPKMRNMFVSAVASSTAVGTLETLISWAVQAWTSIWS